VSPEIEAWLALAYTRPARRECWTVHTAMGPEDDGATCGGECIQVVAGRVASYGITHANATTQERTP
jgi:hypothetical protein